MKKLYFLDKTLKTAKRPPKQTKQNLGMKVTELPFFT